MIDHAVIAILSLAVQVARLATFGPTTSPGWAVTLSVAIMALYHFLTEWLGGGSPGKRLFGLRVTDTDGARPDAKNVATRTAIFVAVSAVVYLVPRWIVALLRSGPRPFDPETMSSMLAAASLAGYFAPLLLFITARRDHEMAALHEILSGTRVRRALSVVRSAAIQASRQEAIAAEPPDSVTGPVARSCCSRCSRPRATCASGVRSIPCSGGTCRSATRPGTPRCTRATRPGPARTTALVGRRRLPSDARDAFEAPAGAALRVLAATPQPWSIVRQWLLDLAEEVAAGEAAGEPPALSLDHVWITSTAGRCCWISRRPVVLHRQAR